jgi:fibronectin type 3 domain-containing protein
VNNTLRVYFFLKRKRYRVENTFYSVDKRLNLFFLFSLFTIYCLLFSCGKKAEPALELYEKPDPPSGLRAIHRESELTLLWDFPKDKEQSIKGFYLMRSTGRDFEKIAFPKNNIRSYVDTNFKIGSEYKYKIISQDARGKTSNDSNIIYINPQNPPAPPENLSYKIEYNSLILTWRSAGEGILYNIYKSYKKGLYSLMPLNKEPLKQTFFRDNFDITKPVYYTIRSLKDSSIRDEGPASEEIEINPSEFVPSAPVGIQAIATEENIYLTWKESPETWIVGYKVYREIDKKEGFLFIGETQTPVFIDKDKPLLKRNYRVTAMGPSKESPPAEIKDVVFIPYR